MRDRTQHLLAENVCWDSNTEHELGPPEKENAFDASLVLWADLTALNSMKPARLSVTGNDKQTDGWVTAAVTLKNESNAPAFFVRAEIVNNANGDEILPSHGATTMSQYSAANRSHWKLAIGRRTRVDLRGLSEFRGTMFP